MLNQRVRFSIASAPPNSQMPDWMTRGPFPARPPKYRPGKDGYLTQSYTFWRNVHVQTMDQIWVRVDAGPVVGRWVAPDVGLQWYYHDGNEQTPGDACRFVPPCNWRQVVQRWEGSQRTVTYADSDIQMS